MDMRLPEKSAAIGWLGLKTDPRDLSQASSQHDPRLISLLAVI
jgi:hypothetical protein